MILSLKRYDDDELKTGKPIMFSHTVCITLFKCVNFPIILSKNFRRLEIMESTRNKVKWTLLFAKGLSIRIARIICK